MSPFGCPIDGSSLVRQNLNFSSSSTKTFTPHVVVHIFVVTAPTLTVQAKRVGVILDSSLNFMPFPYPIAYLSEKPHDSTFHFSLTPVFQPSLNYCLLLTGLLRDRLVSPIALLHPPTLKGRFNTAGRVILLSIIACQSSAQNHSMASHLSLTVNDQVLTMTYKPVHKRALPSSSAPLPQAQLVAATLVSLMFFMHIWHPPTLGLCSLFSLFKCSPCTSSPPAGFVPNVTFSMRPTLTAN